MMKKYKVEAKKVVWNFVAFIMPKTAKTKYAGMFVKSLGDKYARVAVYNSERGFIMPRGETFRVDCWSEWPVAHLTRKQVQDCFDVEIKPIPKPKYSKTHSIVLIEENGTEHKFSDIPEGVGYLNVP
jgi:hypothetical protein